MNAILYVLKNGIPWRAMPHDLPHWSTVYHYFRQWQKEGVWEKAVQALVRRDRERAGHLLPASGPWPPAPAGPCKGYGKRGPRGTLAAHKARQGDKASLRRGTGPS
jgi:hypothetical protein